jgi:HEAT repeat protein
MILGREPNVERLHRRRDVKGLIKALANENASFSVKRAAAFALGDIADPEAVAALIATIRDIRGQGSVRTAAATALAESDDVSADVIVKAFCGYARRLRLSGLHGASWDEKAEWATDSIIADGIRRRGSAAVAELESSLSAGGDFGHLSEFRWAVVLLGDIGDPAAIGPLEATSDAADPMDEVRLDISDSLRQLGREEGDPGVVAPPRRPDR